MSNKRMFTKEITDSDAFIELSSASQALYFHLNQGADDDGFNNQIQMAMLKAHASIDDLKILMMKNFIIRFESGVIVIKHWRMHNTLRADRYKPTNYQKELEMLGLKDNGSYTLNEEEMKYKILGCQKVATDKYSIDKNSIVYNNSNNEEEKHYFENEKLNETFLNWLQYKKEKKQTYKETGLKTLINKINKQLGKQSVESVIEDIENCMSRNYSGIFFRNENSTKNTKVINAPSWVETHITSTKQTETIREESIEDLERFFG